MPPRVQGRLSSGFNLCHREPRLRCYWGAVSLWEKRGLSLRRRWRAGRGLGPRAGRGAEPTGTTPLRLLRADWPRAQAVTFGAASMLYLAPRGAVLPSLRRSECGRRLQGRPGRGSREGAMSSLFARSKDFPRTRKSQGDSPPASPSAAARTLRVSALFPGHSCAAGGGGSGAQRGTGPQGLGASRGAVQLVWLSARLQTRDRAA